MFKGLINDLPLMLLSLPAILLSLSVHEASHGLAANKLGDPTAKSMGRLTLNPLKHINPLGFISMLLFRVGWANPVPVNTRYFKKPRRDMAITAAAGPLSNLCLAIICTVLLRLLLIPAGAIIESCAVDGYVLEEELFSNGAFTILSLAITMVYLGISLNLNLMLFNLIPLPPFDGSRIAYIFLPTDLYFKVMRYERYIMIAFIVLLATGILSLPLGSITTGISNGLFTLLDMPINDLYISLYSIISRLPTFSL